jgi:anti-sigma regulatory factor (Ser/Thr protein kinase)
MTRFMMSLIQGGAGGDSSARPGDDFAAVTLTGPADLAGMRAVVRRLLSGHGVDQATVEAIVLATQEASKNALTFQKGTGMCASLTLHVVSGEVLVEVTDCGGGFDVTCEGLDATEPLDEHGRGIFLMRCFMDTLEAVPIGAGCRVRMTKRLGGVDLSERSA